MTTLIWILYLAEVSQALVPTFVVGGIVLAIAMIVITCMQADEAPRGQELSTFMQHIKSRLILPASMILVACLLPSKQLLYIAVGLNVGQQAVESEIGQKSLSLLETWLDKAITDSQTPQQ